MAATKLTLRKIEIAELVLDELLAASDLPPAARPELIRARATVESLRPKPANPGSHVPTRYGPGIIGCGCGYNPGKSATRVSTLYGAYHTHLARIGVPKFTTPTFWGYGPNKGQPV